MTYPVFFKGRKFLPGHTGLISLLLFLILHCFSTAFPAHAETDTETLTVFFEDRPPLAYQKKGKTTGFLVDITSEAARGAGFDIDWQQAPATRSIHILMEDRVKGCSIGWFKVTEREGSLLFTTAISDPVPIVMVANRLSAKRIAKRRHAEDTVADTSMRMIRKRPWHYGAQIEAWLARYRPPVIQDVLAPQHSMALIASGRGEYTFITSLEADYYSRHAHPGRLIFIFSPPDLKPLQPFHILCSKSIGHHSIARLNMGLEGAGAPISWPDTERE